MPKVALVLAGGVSLGSFEGGVIAELLYALDRVNRDGRNDPYILDVITGASAGAMTAALVARATMNNHQHRHSLHDVWVDEIDILKLIENAPANSLLSRKPIEQIAGAHLRLGGAEDQPASYAPDILRMTLTLSNMNGVDYGIPISHAQGETFTSTFFSDRRKFRLSRTDVLDPRTWDRMKEVAIASGNFPFAFAPAAVTTEHDPEDDPYQGHKLDALLNPFFFVDGGLFNNEPIREAVELAREADGGVVDRNRIFLLVDPNLNASKHDAEIRGDLHFVPTAQRLLDMLLGESSANDWLRAERLNNQIGWRDDLIEELRDMVSHDEATDVALQANQLTKVAARIVSKKRSLFGENTYPASYLTDALERTKRQHAHLLNSLSPGQQDMLAHMIFLVNSIAGLDKKQELRLSIIYADPAKTAGDPVASFGGFFSDEWREHDYRLGRLTAHELLPGILKVGPYEREAGAEYEPESDLSKAKMDSIPRETREEVRRVVMGKAKDLIKPHLGGSIKSFLVWEFGLRKRIKELLNGPLELTD